MSLEETALLAKRVQENVQKVIVGKDDVIEQLLIAMIAEGHVLLEDVPGTGKTLMAKAVARSIDSDFKRIQFTPDLLPSDLSGINFYNQQESKFEFRPGPLFTNILLADEINRATPRTQSSLLECMEERQITIDGVTHFLERPFFVVATQNPVETQGTFPLPEAQLDRFLLKISVGYPEGDDGVEVLRRFIGQQPLTDLQTVASGAELIAAQDIYPTVTIHDDLLRYIMKMADATRNHPEISLGISPRGTQALVRTSQIKAALSGREYVTPDDIKAMIRPVWAHRLMLKAMALAKQDYAGQLIDKIAAETSVPTEDQLQPPAPTSNIENVSQDDANGKRP